MEIPINKQDVVPEEDYVVSEIIAYVEENYMARITLDDVVELVNYSKSTINSKMKKTLGTTFNQYLNRYRMQIVIRELNQNPTVDLKQLSFNVGIIDYKYFQEVFQRHLGITPNEYLNINQIITHNDN